MQLIELNYNNSCNFNCEHCFSHNFPKGSRQLSINDVKRLSRQADEVGAWQWHLQGGEPTVWPDLDDVIMAIDPAKFYIFITSNGWLLSEEKACHLAGLGVDKVSIGLDSWKAEKHDSFRHKPGAYKKAIQALFNAKNAGMQANINTVITHQNLRSSEIMELIEFAEKNQFTILFVVATSSGKWAGKTDMLITQEDADYIRELSLKYNFITRDLYPLFDFEWGCRTMNGLVYITPSGDLLSCPFIHISIGNILEEPLSTILERGWRVKYFRNYSPKCLAGEDYEFIKKFMSKPIGSNGLLYFNDIFNDADLYPA